MRYSAHLISTRDAGRLENDLASAGVSPEGIDILLQKVENIIVRVDSVPAAAANIVKQQLLSLGGDAAVHRDVITGRPVDSTVFLIADRRRLAALSRKLAGQPFGLESLGSRIIDLIRLRDNPPSIVSLPEGAMDLSEKPLIMGIINVTPDSFSDGGKYIDPILASDRAMEMVENGASIIDIGGESTRPGSAEIDDREELKRIVPVLERLAGKIDVPISIDTRKASVAKEAIDCCASIINDISALRSDPGMIDVALRSGAAVVLMHMQGTPENMQKAPHYDDAVKEIIEWLEGATEDLVSKGLRRDKIIVDPGIGFGKRLEHNLEIIDRIDDFHDIGYPLLIGYSRKSFLGKITGREAGERLPAGLAALGKCLVGGVQIIRTHDVGETADFIKTWTAIERRSSGA